MDSNHANYMRKAIELAEKARGNTNPNPMVGALVVRNGEVISEGYHEEAGKPHAEKIALKRAGERAKGAELYVTLEPCPTYGRTPPCTESVISSGIKRVVIGLKDPNPQVSGRGIKQLEAAEIEVEQNILSEEIEQQNEVYIKYITTGLPFVLMKAGMSLDGKISLKRGMKSQITNLDSQKKAHLLRSHYDAIAVGINTVISDNPQLTSRLKRGSGKNPTRVVLDSTVKIPLNSEIIKSSSEIRTILATTQHAPQKRIDQLIEKGLEVIVLPSDQEGKVNLKQLLEELGKREVTSLLLEGGATINAAFLNLRLVDKFLFFVAPQLIGGDAPGLIGSRVSKMTDIDFHRVRIIGKDLLIEAYPKRAAEDQGL